MPSYVRFDLPCQELETWEVFVMEVHKIEQRAVEDLNFSFGEHPYPTGEYFVVGMSARPDEWHERKACIVDDFNTFGDAVAYANKCELNSLVNGCHGLKVYGFEVWHIVEWPLINSCREYMGGWPYHDERYFRAADLEVM